MLDEKKDFIFFVIILVLAIGISLFFHIFFKQEADVGFSEIYFSEPDNLPNEVFRDNKYNFSFTVKNLENKPATYEHWSKLELFNLHDVTEGLYKCASQQRKKVSLKWLQGNDSNSNFFYSEIDDYGRINWPNYTIAYRYENVFNSGTFTTSFYDENHIKYSFSISNNNREAVFAYWNETEANYEAKKLDRTYPVNDILINVTDKLEYYFNGKLMFSKKLKNLDNGKLGFRVEDGIVLLHDLIIYKDSPIKVTGSKYIREFDIDSSIIMEKIEELRSSSELNFYLEGRLTSFNDTCSGIYCDELKLFFNSTEDADYFSTINRDVGVEDLLGALNNQGASIAYDSSYRQNSTANRLFWTNFSVSTSFEIFVKPHSFLIDFDDSFMMLFYNSYVYFLSKDENGLTIYKRHSPVDLGVNDVMLESKDENIVVYINQMPLFNIKKEMMFEDISIHTKNSFVIFDQIVASNDDNLCSFLGTSKNCRRVYYIPSQRQLSSRREIKALAEPLKLSAALGTAPFLTISGLFNVNNKTSELMPNMSKGLPLADISQLLDYDIDINPLIINKNILSERYVFNGANARLKDNTNYTFGYNFYLLEGAGLIETSFYNKQDEKIAVFLIDQPRKEVYLFTYYKGSLVKDVASFNISTHNQNNLLIDVESKKAKYILDGKKVFESERADMSNGFYSISVYNTYAEINEIALYDRSNKRRIPFFINSDPCRLKKIDELVFDKGSLFLDNKENKTIFESFNFSRDFNYGLVTTTLKIPERNETEIHFWVVNSD